LELWSSLQRKNPLHHQCQKNKLRIMRSRMATILTVQRKLVDVLILKVIDLLLVFCHYLSVGHLYLLPNAVIYLCNALGILARLAGCY